MVEYCLILMFLSYNRFEFCTTIFILKQLKNDSWSVIQTNKHAVNSLPLLFTSYKHHLHLHSNRLTLTHIAYCMHTFMLWLSWNCCYMLCTGLHFERDPPLTQGFLTSWLLDTTYNAHVLHYIAKARNIDLFITQIAKWTM